MIRKFEIRNKENCKYKCSYKAVESYFLNTDNHRLGVKNVDRKRTGKVNRKN
jgi:hypothetical protein